MIQTLVHAGGMARAAIRPNVAASLTDEPLGRRYSNPRPWRARVIPGAASDEYTRPLMRCIAEQ